MNKQQIYLYIKKEFTPSTLKYSAASLPLTNNNIKQFKKH
jgi:hypothetical protein